MIRKASEFKKEIVPELCGGKGDSVLMSAFSSDEIKSKVCFCGTVTLEKGCTVGLHQHTDNDEIYYILSGVGSVDEGTGVRKLVTAGDAILTGDGAFHDMINEADEPLVFLAIVINY
ncbi:MAG: cupin [Clostridiales bacterium]|nr:MAG: cupin [Clostridiales bacterium]